MIQPKHIYRPDIDGLRAVAVLAVVGFHAFPNTFPGGFIGVDVFFIISGFLITGIILEAVDNGRFTFADFYVRRARRIFPALVLVLVCCLLAGWLLMMPNDFLQLGKHTFGGASFISNILYFFEADYFDGDAGYKPLLHLWSLGVEEQYYLFWPVMLFFCRGNRSTAMRMIIGVGLASFALNIYLTPLAPEAAFYLPVTRFWELMLGSALAVLKPKLNLPAETRERPALYRNVAAVLGAAAIVLAFVLLDATKEFPGWWALLVSAGTCAVIWAGPDTVVNRLLTWRPMVLIGLISYPLYLWHWPLISFSWNIYGWDVPKSVRVAMVVLSFLLAWLTYRFIEGPVRTRRPPAQVVGLAQGLTVAVAIIGAIGALAYFSVLKPRSAGDPQILAIADAVKDGTSPEGVETIRGTTGWTILFIGDSHMAQYRPRLRQLAEAPPFELPDIELHTFGGCPPLPQLERAIRGYCSKVMTTAFDRAAAMDVRTVVIGAAWIRLETLSDLYVVGSDTQPHQLNDAETDEVLMDFSARLTHLREAGKNVIVLTSSPGGPLFDPRMMVERSHVTPRAHYREFVSRAEATQSTQYIDAKIRAAAGRAGVTVVEPSAWICPGDRCRTVDTAGRPISADGWHMRPQFVRENLQGLDGVLRMPPQLDGAATSP
ncbi:MAG: acyltransferase family protein [Steroidobacteraceae bacterium]